MGSTKGLLINALGALILRQGKVSRVREISPRFRWLEVRVEGLRDLDWTPGDKVQVLLPDMEVRTYTPISWNRTQGTTEFLLYRNQPLEVGPAAEHPGTRWIRTVSEGAAFRFVGPQRSLAADAGASVVLFGDETSFAVALSLRTGSGSPACVFEVSSRAESAAVLAELGLPEAVCVERQADDSHLSEVGAQLEKRVAARKNAQLLMSGRAQAIQLLKSRRRSAGQARAHKTKAYWSLGKAGLD